VEKLIDPVTIEGIQEPFPTHAGKGSMLERTTILWNRFPLSGTCSRSIVLWQKPDPFLLTMLQFRASDIAAESL
jgi:hypothetical protein